MPATVPASLSAAPIVVVERGDDGLESEVFQVLLMLATDCSVLRNHGSGHMRAA